MKLCECGCGQPAPIADRSDQAQGYVKGRARRFIHGHNSRIGAEDYISRNCGFDTPCWIWQRNTTRGGYGLVNRGGQNLTAHRYFYEQAGGVVPAGMELDHLCNTPACVRPEHLEAVTHSENVRRAFARRESMVATGLRAYRIAQGLTQTQLAALLGCAQTAISAWERGVNPLPDWLGQRIHGAAA